MGRSGGPPDGTRTHDRYYVWVGGAVFGMPGSRDGGNREYLELESGLVDEYILSLTAGLPLSIQGMDIGGRGDRVGGLPCNGFGIGGSSCR